MSDRPLPPPFGVPEGPALDTPQLLAEYLSGATCGYSADARLEGPLMRAGRDPLAIRLQEGVLLVRAEVAESARAVRAALEEAMAGAGIGLVEGDTPLAGIVEIEVVGRRGDMWDLWASDADRGRAALVERAAGDMPGLLEAERAQREDAARIDATLSEIERDL